MTAADQLSQATGTTPAADPDSDERSQTFKFEHKVFSMDGGYFSYVKNTQEAAFHIPLGDLKGSIAIPVLRSEFDLNPDTKDGKLLGIVEKSLRYVREIRPNDSIPHELLDGTASWTVEEKHRVIARNRLTVQLVSWLSGGETQVVDLTQLEQLSEDPQTKARVQEAFSRAAEKLGIGADRKQEVVDMIDKLARELSYIEALRDRYTRVQYIGAQLALLSKLYKREPGVRNEIFRMQVLIRAPLADFDSMFTQADAQTGEILAVLRNIGAQTKFIREMRDELHHRLMLWDEMINPWAAVTVERSPDIEALLKDTYRFLARNFAISNDWPLAGRRGR
ncbi:hypothetical protein [Skermanella pratensis]|uniref:hypothetical protein n=1 Tax=Skermanella pratensis TaxID=2233999 RepID=UPI001300DA34|nr:hypothetical protein [Skermanella pratensis]